MALSLFTRAKSRTNTTTRPASDSRKLSTEPTQRPFTPAPQKSLSDDPGKRMQEQGRYAVLLRDTPYWKSQPHGLDAVNVASGKLERRMALVPAGTVCIPSTLSAQPGDSEIDVEVQPFLLDVHAVTNARYQEFVDDGGYDELDYWPEEIWPHLIEFKDMTGDPAPRFWHHGRHDANLSDHPVVGISWYEAQAFSLWVGQRLPTETEWQMSACWHINSSADIMRRFPWGDAMDNQRCNIWSSKNGQTVPVDKYPRGAAPNQVLQLVGNTWEWTDAEYHITDDEGRPVLGEMPMQSIRGGAFDTYFESQATALFRTGQIALARTPNTGFRCAMDLSQATWLTEDSDETGE